MKPYVKIKYPDLEPGYPEDYVGVSMMIGNKKTVISIQDDGRLYCQVEYDKREQRLEESLLIGLRIYCRINMKIQHAFGNILILMIMRAFIRVFSK